VKKKRVFEPEALHRGAFLDVSSKKIQKSTKREPGRDDASLGLGTGRTHHKLRICLASVEHHAHILNHPCWFA